MISDVINRFSTTRSLTRLYKRITYTPAMRVVPIERIHTDDFLYLYISLRVGNHNNVKVFVDHNTVFIKAKTKDVKPIH